jgi:hypothetical protein
MFRHALFATFPLPKAIGLLERYLKIERVCKTNKILGINNTKMLIMRSLIADGVVYIYVL